MIIINIELNYGLIGQRIKDIRKEKNLSQEKLAEMTNYSTPHIGHIEVASTKLSLQALVNIANALGVTPDKILADVIYKSEEYLTDEFADLLKDCTTNELYMILQTAKTIKNTMRLRNLK